MSQSVYHRIRLIMNNGRDTLYINQIELEAIIKARRTKIENIIHTLTDVMNSIKQESSIAKLQKAVDKLQQGNLYEYDLKDSSNKDFIKYLIGYTANQEKPKISRSPSHQNRHNFYSNFEDPAKISRSSRKTQTEKHTGLKTFNRDYPRALDFGSKARERPNEASHKVVPVKRTSTASVKESVESSKSLKSLEPRVTYKSYYTNEYEDDCEEDYIFTTTNLKDFPILDLQDIDSVEFNLFDFVENNERQVGFIIISKYIFNYGTNSIYFHSDKDKVNSLLNDIYNGYNRNVQYHNDLHAVDLCQTLYAWFLCSNFPSAIGLSDLDLCGFYLGALIHDFKHPGTNNNFHINFLTDIALTFNDISVLENYHISEAFKIMQKPQNDFYSIFSSDQFKVFRRRMIESVLATDMSKHALVMSNVKSKLEFKHISNGENADQIIDWSNEKTIFNDQQEILNFIIHLGDLSHNTKKFELSFHWTMLLHEEFFTQGDKEKKASKPVSFLCDRETTNIEKGQIGFIKGLVYPSYEILSRLIPKLGYTMVNLRENLKRWEELTAEAEQSKNF